MTGHCSVPRSWRGQEITFVVYRNPPIDNAPIYRQLDDLAGFWSGPFLLLTLVVTRVSHYHNNMRAEEGTYSDYLQLKNIDLSVTDRRPIYIGRSAPTFYIHVVVLFS